jgi:hypothetical protein
MSKEGYYVLDETTTLVFTIGRPTTNNTNNSNRNRNRNRNSNNTITSTYHTGTGTRSTSSTITMEAISSAMTNQDKDEEVTMATSTSEPTTVTTPPQSQSQTQTQQSYRVVEHASASLCKFEVHTDVDSSPIVFAAPAVAAAEDGGGDDAPAVTSTSSVTLRSATVMDPSHQVRIGPMAQTCGGWDIQHFHPDLQLPSNLSITRDGMLVTFEGQCVMIG